MKLWRCLSIPSPTWSLAVPYRHPHSFKVPTFPGVALNSARFTNSWVPFTTTTGNRPHFFLEKFGFIQAAAYRMLDVYIRAFNVIVRADQTGNFQELDSLFLSEFGEGVLRSSIEFVEAAKKEYQIRRDRSSHPVKLMKEKEQLVLPAVGILRILVEEALNSLERVDEAQGIAVPRVVDVCFKRRTNGPFIPMVKFQTQETPKPKTGTRDWLAQNHRHPYSDIGFAVAPDGLYVSLLSPKDSRVPIVVGKNGAVRYIDQLDFQCGKAPIHWHLQLDWFLEPNVAETLWFTLKKLRLQLRTVVLDASFLPILPQDVRRATVRFHRWFRDRCMESRIVYDRVPTIGAERRSSRAFLMSAGPLEKDMLRVVMTWATVECPTCRGEVLVETDLSSCAPTRAVKTCATCHTPWQLGLLLANRARTHGAQGWVPEDSYSCA
jgi:hypothetical protein